LLWIALVLVGVVVVGVVVFVREVATHHYQLSGYVAHEDGDLTVSYVYAECGNFRKASLVEETSERVVVAVTYIPDFVPDRCDLIGDEGSATFQLKEPLGDRSVYFDDGEEYDEMTRRRR
jgi:hypothetical protein